LAWRQRVEDERRPDGTLALMDGQAGAIGVRSSIHASPQSG
jgi:hypothetical protein